MAPEPSPTGSDGSDDESAYSFLSPEPAPQGLYSGGQPGVVSNTNNSGTQSTIANSMSVQGQSYFVPVLTSETKSLGTVGESISMLKDCPDGNCSCAEIKKDFEVPVTQEVQKVSWVSLKEYQIMVSQGERPEIAKDFLNTKAPNQDISQLNMEHHLARIITTDVTSAQRDAQTIYKDLIAGQSNPKVMSSASQLVRLSIGGQGGTAAQKQAMFDAYQNMIESLGNEALKKPSRSLQAYRKLFTGRN